MESSEQINKNEAELKVKLDSILSSNLLEPNLDNTKWKANETGGNETIEALYSLSEFFEFDDPSRSYCLKNFIEKKRIDMSEELAEKYAIAVKVRLMNDQVAVMFLMTTHNRLQNQCTWMFKKFTKK